MRLWLSTIFCATAVVCRQDPYLSALPKGFSNANGSWAFISYSSTSVAAITGTFNRTLLQAPWTAQVSDTELKQANSILNGTDFVAYDAKFFDLIGASATITKLRTLPFMGHEAACFNTQTKELFFVQWGPPGRNWQYILDTKTNTLRNITTTPPTWNVHGCVFYNGSYHVVTDGGPTNTALLARIDPKTLTSTTLLNNYYEQPFDGFNDLDIDQDGNFWLADDLVGWGLGLTPFYPQVASGAYFVSGQTMRPRLVTRTMGQANGIAAGAKRADGSYTVYIGDTGVFPFPGPSVDKLGRRDLTAYDTAGSKAAGLLTNPRLFNNPIYYIHDGVRVSRNGYVFTGTGEGVDVIDPVSGLTMGSIRVGGGSANAVNLAFGQHELWIVGAGGVWHVSGIVERLDRDW